MKLVSITKSDRAGKKLKAVFREADGSQRTTHFGAEGYSDYTQHGDKGRRSNYLSRHKTNENWSSPTTAGSLSRWILWGNSTSLRANIADFRKRFRL